MDHFGVLIEATAHLATPFLAFDDGVVQSNIERVQDMCDGAGVDLRPHIKTHKSAELTRRQLAAGAIGVTCATASEAIALGRAGVATDVFISVPIFVDGPKLQLIREAIGLHQALSLTVDSATVAESVIESVDASVTIMVEVDAGQHRTGLDPFDAAELAASLGLRFGGFVTHGGHGYAPGQADAAAADERRSLAEALSAFGSGRVLSAGSTPTLGETLGTPVTEVRPGTYVYGDHQQLLLGSMEAEHISGGVIATVIHSEPGRYVIDAGAKSLSKDRVSWIESFGGVVGDPGSVIEGLNDNHGMVRSAAPHTVGERVLVVPNHICPVVDLFDGCWRIGTTAVFSPTELRGCQT